MVRACKMLVGLAVLVGLNGLPAQELGVDIVGCQITLPNGTTYLKGATAPVKDLVVGLTLTNKTQKEDTSLEVVQVRKSKHMSFEEQKKYGTELVKGPGGEPLEGDALVSHIERRVRQGLTKTENIELKRINPQSLHFNYVEPQLGPQQFLAFVITKVTDDPDAQIEPIPFDYDNQYTSPVTYQPRRFLAPGTSTEEFILPVGKFYNIVDPGTYQIKAIVKGISSSQMPAFTLQSNTLQFTVIPYKRVALKQSDLVRNWEDYERGHPKFDYMIYELDKAGPYREIYYVQRFLARGLERFEWHRLCTVDQNYTSQVALIDEKRVAVFTKNYEDTHTLYTLDFNTIEAGVTSKPYPQDGKLVVEGEQVTVQ